MILLASSFLITYSIKCVSINWCVLPGLKLVQNILLKVTMALNSTALFVTAIDKKTNDFDKPAFFMPTSPLWIHRVTFVPSALSPIDHQPSTVLNNVVIKKWQEDVSTPLGNWTCNVYELAIKEMDQGYQWIIHHLALKRLGHFFSKCNFIF